MVRKIFSVIFLAGLFICDRAGAQSSGSQDSTSLSSPALRARRDTYIIEPFPSPAFHGQFMNIQVYNHNSQEFSVDITDVRGRLVKTLQQPEMLPNGIHSYQFNTGLVAAGTYYIRLITYSSAGAQDPAQNLRFIVVH